MNKVVLVAGEASGDAIGEGLVKKIKAAYPQAQIYGVGGSKMISAGLIPWGTIEELSVMGIVEVLSHLPRILKLRKKILKNTLSFKPDIYIGIDAPDFNLGLEEKFKKSGIPTIHYVSPTIWAWKPGRIKKIKRATSSVLCVFPFEPEIYKKSNHRAVYIGHPLADQINFDFTRENYCQSLGLNFKKNYLALLPGSRKFEVERLLPIFLETAQKFKKNYPEIQFLIPVARESLKNLIQEHLKNYPDLSSSIHCVMGQAQAVLGASKLALLASGTVTLEAALLNIPSVVAYRLSNFSYWIAKKLVKLNYVSLPNLLLNQPVFPEFLQEAVTAENLYLALKNQYEKYQNQNPSFGPELKKLLVQNASEQALREIEHVINTHTPFNRRR